jgi:hypothetical protein
MSGQGQLSLTANGATVRRFVFGLGGLALLCLALPYCCSSTQALLAATAAVGVCYSIAFGTSYQLVTHFPPACTVSLTTGGYDVQVGPLKLPTRLEQKLCMLAPQHRGYEAIWLAATHSQLF